MTLLGIYKERQKLSRKNSYKSFGRKKKTIYLCTQMNNVLLHISLTPYLAEWFIHKHGGDQPVKLHRGSPESYILEQGLRTKPQKGKTVPVPEDANVVIKIPNFRLVDPRRYPYVPEKVVNQLKQSIRKDFKIELWYELHQLEKLSLPITDIVEQFMRKHGITYSNEAWETIRQTYYRMRDVKPKGKKKFSTEFVQTPE